MVSISESVAYRFTSSTVSASTLSASVGAASVAAVLSIAGVFDADASGGVYSITSTT
jgi:predicted double-glycine peptidase